MGALVVALSDVWKLALAAREWQAAGKPPWDGSPMATGATTSLRSLKRR